MTVLESGIIYHPLSRLKTFPPGSKRGSRLRGTLVLIAKIRGLTEDESRGCQAEGKEAAGSLG